MDSELMRRLILALLLAYSIPAGAQMLQGIVAANSTAAATHSAFDPAVNPTIITYSTTNAANDTAQCLNTSASPNNCFSGTTFWAVGTVSKSTGKCYLEMTAGALLGDTVLPAVGFTSAANAPYNTNVGLGIANSVGFNSNGSGGFNGGAGPTAPTFASGDTLGLAIDYTDSRVWMRNTNAPATWNAGGGSDPTSPSTGFDISAITGAALFPVASMGFFSRNQTIVNTGQAAFAAAIPAGYSACF
jgi:hypothetical protein